MLFQFIYLVNGALEEEKEKSVAFQITFNIKRGWFIKLIVE